MNKKLVGQKSAVSSKLIAKAKEEAGVKDQGDSDKPDGPRSSKGFQMSTSNDKKENENVNTRGVVSDDLLSNAGICKIFVTREEKQLIESLRLPNP